MGARAAGWAVARQPPTRGLSSANTALLRVRGVLTSPTRPLAAPRSPCSWLPVRRPPAPSPGSSRHLADTPPRLRHPLLLQHPASPGRHSAWRVCPGGRWTRRWRGLGGGPERPLLALPGATGAPPWRGQPGANTRICTHSGPRAAAGERSSRFPGRHGYAGARTSWIRWCAGSCQVHQSRQHPTGKLRNPPHVSKEKGRKAKPVSTRVRPLALPALRRRAGWCRPLARTQSWAHGCVRAVRAAGNKVPSVGRPRLLLGPHPTQGPTLAAAGE